MARPTPSVPQVSVLRSGSCYDKCLPGNGPAERRLLRWAIARTCAAAGPVAMCCLARGTIATATVSAGGAPGTVSWGEPGLHGGGACMATACMHARWVTGCRRVVDSHLDARMRKATGHTLVVATGTQVLL